MKIKIPIVFLLSFFSLGVIGQELSVEQLYFRYNPKNTSLTTQYLIANEYINETGLNLRNVRSVFRNNSEGKYDYTNRSNLSLKPSRKQLAINLFNDYSKAIERDASRDDLARLGVSVYGDAVGLAGGYLFKSYTATKTTLSKGIAAVKTLFGFQTVKEGINIIGKRTKAGRLFYDTRKKAESSLNNSGFEIMYDAFTGRNISKEGIAANEERLIGQRAKNIMALAFKKDGTYDENFDMITTLRQKTKEDREKGLIGWADELDAHLDRKTAELIGSQREYAERNKEELLRIKNDEAAKVASEEAWQRERAMASEESKKILEEGIDKFKTEMEKRLDFTEQTQQENLDMMNDIKNSLQGEIQDLGDIIFEYSEYNENRNDLQDQEIGQLNQTLQDHRGMIAKNQAGISILLDDLLSRSSPDQLKAFLKEEGSAISEFIDAEEGRRELLTNRLDSISRDLNLLSWSETLSNFQAAGNLTFEALTTLGIIKGEDAQRVAKVMWYANKGFDIANTSIAIARAGGGDPTAWIQLGFQALSLFGNDDEEQPSELQIVLEQMHGRFDVIEEKIDTITSLIIQSHESLSEQIQINKDFTLFLYNKIDVKLDEILEKQNELLSLSRSILTEDIAFCKDLEKNRIDRGISLDKYSDFVRLRSQLPTTCTNCLKGLQKVVALDNSNYFSVDHETSEYLTQLVLRGYKPASDLFRYYYESDLITAVNLLNASYTDVQLNQYAYLFIKDQEGLRTSVDPEVVLGLVLLNHEDIALFTDLYLNYFPFFEFQKNENFEPYSLQEYLSLPTEDKELAFGKLKNYIDKLLSFNRHSTAQQTLMAGNLLLEPIYYTIFQGQHCTKQFEAYSVLQNNPLLNHNFSVYLLRKNLAMDDPSYTRNKEEERYEKYKEYYYKVVLDGDLSYIERLKSLMYVDNIDIIHSNGQLLIQLKYIEERGGQNIADATIPLSCSQDKNSFDVLMRLPTPEEVQINRMEYPESISILKESEAKLLELRTLFKQADGYVEDWFAQQQYKTQMINDLLKEN